jgi:ribosome-binding protein aMBF1 (putative translation factor)
MKFSDILIEHRESHQWSRVELARRMGVDLTLICEWEKGNYMPNLANAMRLSRILGFDLYKIEQKDLDAQAARKRKKKSK